MADENKTPHTPTTDFGGSLAKPPQSDYSSTVGVWNPVTGKMMVAKHNGLCPVLPSNEPK